MANNQNSTARRSEETSGVSRKRKADIGAVVTSSYPGDVGEAVVIAVEGKRRILKFADGRTHDVHVKNCTEVRS